MMIAERRFRFWAGGSKEFGAELVAGGNECGCLEALVMGTYRPFKRHPEVYAEMVAKQVTRYEVLRARSECRSFESRPGKPGWGTHFMGGWGACLGGYWARRDSLPRMR
jgi:hypothetical protein